MFELTHLPIDPAAARARLQRSDAGALTIFEGRVRDHHLGRAVTHLEYEAFDELALHEGNALVAEAERLHPGATVHCMHRTGRLEIGEVAIWIGATAPHRAASFAACRQVIEEIKRRLPVWKKEHHPDGAAEWVNCTQEAANARTDVEFHARQIALPEVGAAGQQRLAAARVLVVGAGGLGCPAALYLAGAGVGRIVVADGGRVELSNLARQVLFTAPEVGAPKALAAAARLRQHNPAIEVVAHEGEITSANAATLVAGQGVVLDCTDNFTARFAIHDAARAAGVPVVSAAVHRFEGELNVYLPGEHGCLHCQWPGRHAAELDAAGNCAGGPVFAPAVGVLGILQAAETIKLILGLPGTALHETRLVNLLDGTATSIARTPRADCPCCGATGPAVGAVAPADEVWLDDERLALLAAPRTIVLPEAGEILPPSARLGENATRATTDLAALRALAREGPLVLSCRSGVRSAALARLLRAEGFAAVYARRERPIH